jgi:hypothetical protein
VPRPGAAVLPAEISSANLHISTKLRLFTCYLATDCGNAFLSLQQTQPCYWAAKAAVERADTPWNSPATSI